MVGVLIMARVRIPIYSIIIRPADNGYTVEVFHDDRTDRPLTLVATSLAELTSIIQAKLAGCKQ